MSELLTVCIEGLESQRKREREYKINWYSELKVAFLSSLVSLTAVSRPCRYNWVFVSGA